MSSVEIPLLTVGYGHHLMDSDLEPIPFAWDLQFLYTYHFPRFSEAASLATIFVSPSFHNPCFKVTVWYVTNVNLSNVWVWIFLCVFIIKICRTWLRFDPRNGLCFLLLKYAELDYVLSLGMGCVFNIKICRTWLHFEPRNGLSFYY